MQPISLRCSAVSAALFLSCLFFEGVLPSLYIVAYADSAKGSVHVVHALITCARSMPRMVLARKLYSVKLCMRSLYYVYRAVLRVTVVP